jgi:hypothetical protein
MWIKFLILMKFKNSNIQPLYIQGDRKLVNGKTRLDL